MPLLQTSGNVTADGYGGGVAAVPQYIEDVFSTYLYTGNSATNAISNGIDLSTKGGLVWIKNRSFTTDHFLADTVRGIGGVSGSTYYLQSNTTNAQSSSTNLMSADATGFTLLPNATSTTNGSYNYASWTFRKQPKFFDVVTYTGTGSAQNIAHSLGSTPGCIIVKQTSGAANWAVYHQDIGNTKYLLLNGTGASVTSSLYWNNTSPTSTQFTVGTSGSTNLSGATYVAYLFAHNAGGFGLTGTDNVISCGNFSFSAGKATVSLGYEPQYLLLKKTNGAEQWWLFDTMRGMTASLTGNNYLTPNSSVAEADLGSITQPTATGFYLDWSNQGITTGDYIYIAIRRGPMKVPTSGTTVFNNNLETSSTNPQTLTTGFPVDLNISTLNNTSTGRYVVDRLRGTNTSGYKYLFTNGTNAEATATGGGLGFDNNTGMVDSGYWNTSGAIYWSWRRAPSFFDEVCYTGDGTGGSGRAITHNLGVAPELVIVKSRSNAYAWRVWQTSFGSSYNILLNSTAAVNTNFYLWANTYLAVTNPTTQFGVYGDGTTDSTNTSGATYVAYLFATCAGVSKVGSYTGNGTTQTINCGFTGGARFVLIKRTDASGDWYVYDTARGMTTLTDPYLLLNSTATQTATLGSVTTVSTGFALNASILAAINTNGASYIFLAIA